MHKAVPILYSTDILKSLDYYTKVLGFENRWEWGHPPTFGGISKDAVEIFFCKDGQGNPGTWLSIFIDNVDELYETIKSRGAKILSPPQTMEWGVREMLVEDPDGHKIRFGHSASFRKPGETMMPSTVRIIARTPSVKELNQLISSVGWSSSLDDVMKELPQSAIEFVVVAEDMITDEIIGCAFLLGDKTDFYYVKNVIVHPRWQGKRIGTELMKSLNKWLDENAPDHAFVGLHTGQNLAPFYHQFGFEPAYGMIRRIRRNEKEG
jgi:N-acetylglutamate synthase-like GNAT family acetyltransferase/catechol 2,3-dioxygenase-like lactoylglutathione lyase family enzyme